MREVTLNEILESRENRVFIQKKLIEKYNVPLVSFTMNIAGPIKITPEIERGFFEGIDFLKKSIPEEKILHEETQINITGCQAMFCISMDAPKIKSICVSIEESIPLGRLFDMDVIDTDFSKLSRNELRGCIVCGAKGRECAASRLHSVKALQDVTSNIISDYFRNKDFNAFSEIAVKSLLDEVYTTPKPGLVDKNNNGSHRDMDITTFEKSAAALKPYFYQCLVIGYESSKKEPYETFNLLKVAGIDAEKTMYNATKGINTHKGIIYSLGVMCGAVGRLWCTEKPVSNIDEILSLCSKITKDAVAKDFSTITSSTSGGKYYIENGIKGIRGEVSSGFPTIKNIALPVFTEEIKKGQSLNDAGVIALLNLIANVDDTNIYNRGGKEGAAFAAEYAKKILEMPFSIEDIEKMDIEFISKNLSPGGCADLLAITYFLYELTKKSPQQ